jgi:hypothetical protein
MSEKIIRILEIMFANILLAVIIKNETNVTKLNQFDLGT